MAKRGKQIGADERMIPKVANEEITLPSLKVGRMKVRVRGDLLVIKCFDKKSQEMMKEKSTGRAQRRALVDVHDSFNRARYIYEDKDCCLAVHFKKAMISAANDVKLKMTDIRRQIFCVGSLNGGEYVPILDAKTNKPMKPRLREDWVRQNQGKGATMTFRPEYTNWAAEFVIEYNSSVITAEQIMNLLVIAGFSCGIGENRPSKSGNGWGRFELDMKSVEKVA